MPEGFKDRCLRQVAYFEKRLVEYEDIFTIIHYLDRELRELEFDKGRCHKVSELQVPFLGHREFLLMSERQNRMMFMMKLISRYNI